MILSGSKVICPGEVGVFYCTVDGGTGLVWEVDGRRRGFDGFSRPCCPQEGPISGCRRNSCSSVDHCATANSNNGNFIAYLTRIQLNQHNHGYRSSLLVYTPEPDTIASINITCRERRVTQKSMVLIVCKSIASVSFDVQLGDRMCIV